MEKEFVRKYEELIFDDIPKRNLDSAECGGRYLKQDEEKADPWVGIKPHAKNGFVEQYCSEY